jgi:hypothetical protein
MPRWFPLLAVVACAPSPLTTSTDASAAAPKSTLDIPGVEKLCPTRVPGEGGGNYWVMQAFTQGAGASIEASRRQATENLLQNACAGLSEVRCAAMRQHVQQWGDGYYDKRAKIACGSVTIDKKEARTWDQDISALETSMRTLAAGVVQKAGGKPVNVLAPKWASGCSAGTVGQAVRASFIERMGTIDGAKLAPENQKGAGTVLKLSLSPGPQGVTVVAIMQNEGEIGVTPLPGFSFPRDLFNIPPDETGMCRGDAELGLVDGQRPGITGLHAELSLPGVVGQACEGQTVNAHVRVDKPSRVQIYSVAKDGRGYLIWDGDVEREGDSVPLTLTAMPDDETLLAVAAPRGGTLGIADGWRPDRYEYGFCEVSGGVKASMFPSAAALGSFTYRVVPGGTEGCSLDPSGAERLDQANDLLAKAPPCR